MQVNLVRIELLLPRKDVEAIDRTIKQGEFATRTDVIRTAIRRLVEDKERRAKMEKSFELIDKRLKEKGIKPEELLAEFGRRSSRQAEELIKDAKSKPPYR